MSLSSTLLYCIRSVAVALVTAASLAFPTRGQSPEPARFEVASVRMVKPFSQAELNSGKVFVTWSDFPTHNFYAHHVTLGLLLSLAYGVPQRYMDRLPDWADEQTYDIDANVEGNQSLTYEQMKPVLQNLLEQRFALAAHLEMREQAGYSLVTAKGKPKIRPATANAKSSPSIFPDRIVGQSIDIAFFTRLLAGAAGGPVQDQTSLPGKYDIDLRFRRANDMDSNLPDIFTAVQEQLGLKLVPAKVPVKYLIVDHVDREPTEN